MKLASLCHLLCRSCLRRRIGPGRGAHNLCYHARGSWHAAWTCGLQASSPPAGGELFLNSLHSTLILAFSRGLSMKPCGDMRGRNVRSEADRDSSGNVYFRVIHARLACHVHSLWNGHVKKPIRHTDQEGHTPREKHGRGTLH